MNERGRRRGRDRERERMREGCISKGVACLLEKKGAPISKPEHQREGLRLAAAEEMAQWQKAGHRSLGLLVITSITAASGMLASLI